ncbi:MAG: cyclic nucleotide-binding domain-containing protein [Kofleriaceae bacterium]|nr:cyclic nucleotide-binding domain-containing protein [Kofleriaceae bacterium]
MNFVSPRERILYLKSMSTLSTLPSSMLLPLAEALREQFFRKGKTLIDVDNEIDEAHFLVSGSVDLYWKDENIRTVEAPWGVGFLGIFAQIQGGVRAVATRDTRTLSISRRDLEHVLSNNPKLLLANIGEFARSILEMRGGYPADPATLPEPETGVYSEESSSFVARLLRFSRVPFFATANLDALAELCHHQLEQHWKAGDILWRKGDPSDSNLQLVHGIVQVDREDGAPPMRTGSEYYLGMEGFAGLPRLYTLRCETRVVILHTSMETFLGILEDQFGLAMAMARSFAQTLVGLTGDTAEHSPEMEFANKPIGAIFSRREPRTVL